MCSEGPYPVQEHFVIAYDMMSRLQQHSSSVAPFLVEQDRLRLRPSYLSSENLHIRAPIECSAYSATDLCRARP